MPNILVSLEAKKSLRNELAATPEGRLYMAILTQAISDITDKTDFHTKKYALDWLNREPNPIRDLCLLLAELDKEYILRVLTEKGYINGY